MTPSALEFQKFVSNIAATIAQQFPSEEPAQEAAAALPAPSGAKLPVESYCLDHEKIVWHFPDTDARLSEDVS